MNHRTSPSIVKQTNAYTGYAAAQKRQAQVALLAIAFHRARAAYYTCTMALFFPSAAPFVPISASLNELQHAAGQCRGCDLYRHATQVVFGEGKTRARIMLIGEQPGDQEDLAGRPFIGPAGKLLDSALEAVGIDRASAYVTNAVKHFKWEPRGKRRLHKKPLASEIKACRPWLEREVALVEPQVLVCLGVSAAQAVFGQIVRLKDMRGKLAPSPLNARTLVTIHPSSILRAPDAASRERDYQMFVADLAQATVTGS